MVFPLRREGADMKIFHSPDLEPLLAHCSERLSTPLSDPFAAEIIVVPHADMVRYLKRQLSRSLGATSPKHADGIVANVKFVYPRQIANATVTDFFGTDDSAWDSHRLTWAIAETTEAQKREVPGFRTAPLTVSRRIADLFDRYASHRPEMIKFWRSAGSGGILPGDQQGWLRADGSQNWQQLLFDSVAQFLDNDIAASPRAVHDVGAFRQAVSEAHSRGDFPERITVFGVNALSRASRHVIDVLAEFCDVAIYVVYAASSSLPILTDSGLLVRPDHGVGNVQHSLYARWGVQVIEGAAALAALGSVEQLPAVPRYDSLLHQLQHDIITDTARHNSLSADDIQLHLKHGDGSFQVHACYGTTRQAEAVRDSLLHLLNNDPTLRLSDIAIVCTDVDSAAPVLNAVLNPPRTPSATELPRLTIDVLGSSAQSADSLSEAFFSVLRLAVARCSPSDVLDVASLLPIRRHFGFTDEHLTTISTWADQLGITYGLNGAHRESVSGMRNDIVNGTWHSALQRLLIGVAVPGDVDRIGPGGVVPYDGVNGNDIDTAGLIAEFLHRIGNVVQATTSPRGLTIAEWRTIALSIVTNFISVAPRDTEKYVRLTTTLAAFGEDADAAHVDPERRYPIADLMSLTTEYFSDGISVFGSKSEAITVASFSALQHLPYRVIVLFSADESAFAGAHADGDDVLSNTPCVGEPIYSLLGRQTLLNLLMAARDSFIITCTGADVSNNKHVPLAVPLNELLELAAITLHSSTKAGTQRVLINHARQNFDDRSLTPGEVFDTEPFTFDRHSLVAREAIESRSAPKQNLSGKGTIPQQPVTTSVALRTLTKAVTNPSELFVSDILNVTLPEMPEKSSANTSNAITGDAIMNLTLDPLRHSSEGRTLLSHLIREASDGTAVTTIIENWQSVRPHSGVLPPNTLGTILTSEIGTEISEMVHALPDSVRTLPAGVDIDCRIALNDIDTTLRVNKVLVGPELVECVRIRFKRFSESMLLELWLEVAALTLHFDGRPITGHLSARGTDSKFIKKPVYYSLALKGDNNEERKNHARIVLSCAHTIFQSASLSPVPLFEKTSRALNKKNEKKKQSAFDADIQSSNAVRFLYGDQSLEAITQLPILDIDSALVAENPEAHLIGRAELYADFLWNCFDESTILTGTNVNTDDDNDNGDDE